LNRVLNQKRPIALKKKKRKMILLHDNARPHVAKVIKDMLSTLQWEILPHIAYHTSRSPIVLL